jgi:membrane dipeptidase
MEFLSRGWTDAEVVGLMGGNLLRVMDEADRVKDEMMLVPPGRAVYEKRTDLPSRWGGKDDAYLPYEVRDVVRGRLRDEL